MIIHCIGQWLQTGPFGVNKSSCVMKTIEVNAELHYLINKWAANTTVNILPSNKIFPTLQRFMLPDT